MPALHPDTRRLLERTIIAARQVAEEGATAVLQSLAVDKDEPFAVLNEAQKEQRRKLRAEARRLGDFGNLVSEVAYEAWHSRLFARFLLENKLLVYQGFAVAKEDLGDVEVQREFGVHSPQALAVALAANMLPGLFEPQDPSWHLTLPPEHAQRLEALLNDLPAPVFEADDSLGWVYQFWQSAQKEKVNAAARGGNRIAAKDVAAVTQLFTEPYMVNWLLDQSLQAVLEDEGRDLSQFKLLDPCCGSGHFLVAAFNRLVTARMQREHLREADAAELVLQENLFGLELDPRCVQLAGFNLLFAAWKRGGHRDLPLPSVACCGLPAEGEVKDWTRLAGPDDKGMQNALWRLYHMFRQSPVLGSLIDPREQAVYLDWNDVEPKLEKALEQFGGSADPVSAIFGGGVKGLLRTARILSGRYDLVVTNVPYLARGKHNRELAEFCAKNYPSSKADLATVFVERCLRFCKAGGQTALVTPQNWLFLGSYEALRKKLLNNVTWQVVAKLGEGGFTSSSAAGAFVALSVLKNESPHAKSALRGWDVSAAKTPDEKAEKLAVTSPAEVEQVAQLRNPDARITLGVVEETPILETLADSTKGISTNDDPLFVRKFWELEHLKNGWEFHLSTVEVTSLYGGCEHIVLYENGKGQMRRMASMQKPDRHMDKRGVKVWGRRGIVVSCMRQLPVALYEGNKFDTNVATIVPKDPIHLPAIWCFCSSPEFNIAVRRIDQALKVTNASLVKVPFDLTKWQQVASKKFPNGLPEPFSSDPTQWLFDGYPQTARDRGGEAVLQVGMARLAGYLWPQQDGDSLAKHTDDDGILPLVPVSGEIGAAPRLRALLEAALDDFSPQLLESLLTDAGYGGKDLATYLRNGFFAAHCKMFHNRPFLWHIWDGRPDGFAAIVNYHKLDHARLEKLAYTYLGDWIKVQKNAAQNDQPGADARLLAAEVLQTKLIAILQGEAPYDIFVRWKKLEEQPIGWNPDLNDGVRLNIRPFVTAGILRAKFTINWNTDRGKNPDGTSRENDVHLTLEEKRKAQPTANQMQGAL